MLSEPARLRLLALAAEEELSIGELAELLGESQPNVSRHAAALRQAGLLARSRARGRARSSACADDARGDPVVADALGERRGRSASATAACARVARGGARARGRGARVLRAPGEGEGRRACPPSSARTSPRSRRSCRAAALALDAGTGDGALLEVLAPVYERVVAVDRSEAQLARARERVARARLRQRDASSQGELDGAASVRRGRAAPAAPTPCSRRACCTTRRSPRRSSRSSPSLCAPGGALVVLDYAHHDDESMREQADAWLGFEPAELAALRARARASRTRASTPIPAPLCGTGPDAHLPWQVMVARKPNDERTNGDRRSNEADERKRSWLRTTR